MTKNWVNRIIEFGYKHASEFVPNPNNWRIHTKLQKEAVSESISRFGVLDVVIENASDGYMIDGHERVWQGLQNDDALLPYIKLDLSEAQEAQAILTIDGTMEMAGVNPTKAEALIKLIEENPERMNKMIEIIMGKYGLLDEQITENKEEENIYVYEIRIKVDHGVYEKWLGVWEELPGENGDEKLNRLLDVIEIPE